MQGVVSSAVAVYGRQQREAAKKKAQQDRAASAAPGFAAPIKIRMREVPVEITNVYESTRPRYAYPYGDEPFQIITMRDRDGHEIAWKTGSIQSVERGDEIAMSGTVKGYTEYQGEDQTEISGARLQKPSHDGASPAGPCAPGR